VRNINPGARQLRFDFPAVRVPANPADEDNVPSAVSGGDSLICSLATTRGEKPSTDYRLSCLRNTVDLNYEVGI